MMDCLSCRDNHNPGGDNIFHVDDASLITDEDMPCLVDLNGLYGSSAGDEISLGFLYQIETNPNADILEILENVELSISGTIVLELFADQCAPTVRSRKRRKPTTRRRSDAWGVSSLPADKVLHEVPCQGYTTRRDCHVIDGAMTLFFDSYTSCNEKLLSDVHGLIRDAMNDGNFSNVHPDIIEIFYWNRKTFANIVVESPPEHSTSLPVFWSFIGIGVAGFLLLFYVLSWRQRRKKNDEWNSVGSIDSDSGDSDSTLLSHESNPQTGIVLVMQAENTVSEKSDSHLGIARVIQVEGSLQARSCSLFEAQSDSQLFDIRPANSFDFDYLPRSLSP